MPQERFNFRDFVRAWSDIRGSSHAHEDLAGYDARRCRAFSAAFGVDLEVPPAVAPPMPDWVISWQQKYEWTRREGEQFLWHDWPGELVQFAGRAETLGRSLESPFAGYLEAPLILMAASDRHGEAIGTPVREAQARIFDMVVELLAGVFPEAAARTVTADTLRASGFDPDAAAPDPYDYL